MKDEQILALINPDKVREKEDREVIRALYQPAYFNKASSACKREMVRRLAHPVIFSVAITDFFPFQWQAPVMADLEPTSFEDWDKPEITLKPKIHAKNILLDCGRQSGKSRMFGEVLTQKSFKTKNCLSVIVAPTLRQSSLMMRTIKEIVRCHPWLENSVVNDAATYLRLNNGSEIYSLPSGHDGSGIRGFAVNGILSYDEAAFINDPVFVAMNYVVSAAGGSTFMASTPLGKRGYFFDTFSDPEKYFEGMRGVGLMEREAKGKSDADVFKKETIAELEREFNLSMGDLERFWVYKIPSMMNPLIPPEFFARIKLEKTSMAYDQEVLADFVEDYNLFFGTDNIRRSIDYDLLSPQDIDWKNPNMARFLEGKTGARYVLGVDLGLEIDPTYIVIVEIMNDGRFIVRYIERIAPNKERAKERGIKKDQLAESDRATFDEVIWKIHDLYYNKNFKFVKGYVDATNNQYVAENLRKEHGLAMLEGVNFGQTSQTGQGRKKLEMMEFLLNLMEKNKFKMPNDPEVVKQFLNYEWEITEYKNVKFTPTNEDAIDSIALACLAGRDTFNAVSDVFTNDYNIGRFGGQQLVVAGGIPYAKDPLEPSEVQGYSRYRHVGGQMSTIFAPVGFAKGPGKRRYRNRLS